MVELNDGTADRRALLAEIAALFAVLEANRVFVPPELTVQQRNLLKDAEHLESALVAANELRYTHLDMLRRELDSVVAAMLAKVGQVRDRVDECVNAPLDGTGPERSLEVLGQASKEVCGSTCRVLADPDTCVYRV